MSDTATREEQRSRLDQFAQASVPVSAGELVAMAPQQAPAIFGAQNVAVRRDTGKVLADLKVLAAAAGDDWFYRFPVKNRKENRTDWIEGPSIKLANDLARTYGNCEVDCRAQDLGSYILFHARFVDLETGFALTRPFQQRKGAARLGGSDEGRRDDITFQIGASKAIRNVVVNALQTMADFAFNEAREALVDKIGHDVERWRQRASERIGTLVDLDRVEAVVGRKVKDWLAPDIARVIAMGKAISDGMATVDETFPPLRGEEPDERRMVDDKLDRFAGDVVEEQPEPGHSAGSEAAASSPPRPNAQETAATPPEDDWEVLKVIDRTLGIATVGSEDVEQRIANLDAQAVWLDEHHPEHGDFCATLMSMAVKVARGDLAKEAARRYLQALAK